MAFEGNPNAPFKKSNSRSIVGAGSKSRGGSEDFINLADVTDLGSIGKSNSKIGLGAIGKSASKSSLNLTSPIRGRGDSVSGKFSSPPRSRLNSANGSKPGTPNGGMQRQSSIGVGLLSRTQSGIKPGGLLRQSSIVSPTRSRMLSHQDSTDDNDDIFAETVAKVNQAKREMAEAEAARKEKEANKMSFSQQVSA